MKPNSKGTTPAKVPQKRRPTIKDVARHAGVSFKTVSRVLNGQESVNADMREAVQSSVAALDYRPDRAARSLRTKRSYAMALIGSGCFSSPQLGGAREFPDYLGDVIVGCSSACRNFGNHLVLEFVVDADEEESRKRVCILLDDVNPDGVLVSPPVCDEQWLLDLFEERGLHYVRLMPGTALERGTIFAIDDHAAAREMTEHLLEKGHRHIGFIGGPANHHAARARQSGFEEAMEAADNTTMVVEHGDFFIESGELATSTMLSKADRPTAIFAANDTMALGVMKVAKRFGLSIPEDLSIAGFDDSAVARMSIPGLTTIRQPTNDLAFAAMEVLAVAANEGRQLENQVHLQPFSLTERGSVAAPLSKQNR